MKNLRRIISHIIALSTVVIISIACSSQWDNYYTETEKTSAYDLLKAESNFSEFLSLIETNQ